MAELIMIRQPGGALHPATDEDADAIKKIKAGDAVRVEVKRIRNYKFLKKWWALAKFAFDIWEETIEPQEYKGIKIEANFDRFRKELIILTGRFDAVYNIRGEVRVEAHSISFANMEQEEFDKLYSDTINVILKKVLNSTAMTEQQLREHVDTVMHYA